MVANHETKSDQMLVPGSTTLEELVLLNCDISSTVLSELLRYPKYLKKFVYTGAGADIHLSFGEPIDGGDYADAVLDHAGTLKSIDMGYFLGRGWGLGTLHPFYVSYASHGNLCPVTYVSVLIS